MLICLVVVFFGAGVWLPYPQLTHFSVCFLLSLHWLDGCLPVQYLHIWTSVLQVLASWPNF